jgi:hypothetical protein
MNRRPTLIAKIRLVMATAAILAMTHSIVAHHSFAAEFDLTRPLHLDGTVTSVRWSNPHVYVILNVKSSRGATEEWRVEVARASILQLLGWNKETVVPGMDVRVGGYPAKNGERIFGSTVFSIPSVPLVFKTPACWWPPDTVTLADIQKSKCSIPDVP